MRHFGIVLAVALAPFAARADCLGNICDSQSEYLSHARQSWSQAEQEISQQRDREYQRALDQYEAGIAAYGEGLQDAHDNR